MNRLTLVQDLKGKTFGKQVNIFITQRLEPSTSIFQGTRYKVSLRAYLVSNIAAKEDAPDTSP